MDYQKPNVLVQRPRRRRIAALIGNNDDDTDTDTETDTDTDTDTDTEL